VTGQPRLLGNAEEILDEAATAGHGGAHWRLRADDRQLDANVIHLPPGDRIESHTGPDVDVLLVVLRGGGELHTDARPLRLTRGGLVWLPSRSTRAIVAGDTGLSYLTVHGRRAPLTIGSYRPAAQV
jgi:quercetin dioxygenase-like cupin family protein